MTLQCLEREKTMQNSSFNQIRAFLFHDNERMFQMNQTNVKKTTKSTERVWKVRDLKQEKSNDIIQLRSDKFFWNIFQQKKSKIKFSTTTTILLLVFCVKVCFLRRSLCSFFLKNDSRFVTIIINLKYDKQTINMIEFEDIYRTHTHTQTPSKLIFF